MWKLAWQEIYCDRDALAEGFDSTQKETTATCSASGCFSVPSVVQGDKFRNSLERDINLRSCIRSLPSRAEIDRCASRITTLRFGERIVCLSFLCDSFTTCSFAVFSFLFFDHSSLLLEMT